MTQGMKDSAAAGGRYGQMVEIAGALRKGRSEEGPGSRGQPLKAQHRQARWICL